MHLQCSVKVPGPSEVALPHAPLEGLQQSRCHVDRRAGSLLHRTTLALALASPRGEPPGHPALDHRKDLPCHLAERRLWSSPEAGNTDLLDPLGEPPGLRHVKTESPEPTGILANELPQQSFFRLRHLPPRCCHPNSCSIGDSSLIPLLKRLANPHPDRRRFPRWWFGWRRPGRARGRAPAATAVPVGPRISLRVAVTRHQRRCRCILPIVVA